MFTNSVVHRYLVSCRYGLAKLIQNSFTHTLAVTLESKWTWRSSMKYCLMNNIYGKDFFFLPDFICLDCQKIQSRQWFLYQYVIVYMLHFTHEGLGWFGHEPSRLCRTWKSTMIKFTLVLVGWNNSIILDTLANNGLLRLVNNIINIVIKTQLTDRSPSHHWISCASAKPLV